MPVALRGDKTRRVEGRDEEEREVGGCGGRERGLGAEAERGVVEEGRAEGEEIHGREDEQHRSSRRKRRRRRRGERRRGQRRRRERRNDAIEGMGLARGQRGEQLGGEQHGPGVDVFHGQCECE